jgi:hypothetical protein
MACKAKGKIDFHPLVRSQQQEKKFIVRPVLKLSLSTDLERSPEKRKKQFGV